MRKLFLLVIPILLLCGCSDSNVQCINSHIEPQIMWYPNGNGSLRMVIVPVTVCDEWKEVEE